MPGHDVAAFAAVPSGVSRPLWSVLIPTYNSTRFLEETLLSVLEQDPGADKMEIVVVDDCSSDDPAKLVELIAGSRVRFLPQTATVGKIRNFETGLRESRGRLIHQLHGDDRVRAGFYAAMESAFDEHSGAGAFFSSSHYIDEHGRVIGRTGTERNDVGILEGWLDKIYISQRIQTPSIVLRREVYESLGGFDRRLDVFEDWEMWIRVASAYPVGFIPEPLADYRIRASSSTVTSAVAGTRAGTLRKLLGIVDGYLPPATVARNREARNRAQAQYFLQFIPQMISLGSFKGLLRSYIDALSFSRDPRTVYRMMTYTIRAISLPPTRSTRYDTNGGPSAH
jgi:glycosyltransferase involved in cell wall biosynthesis